MKLRWPALLRLTRVLSEIASSLRQIASALDRAYPIEDKDEIARRSRRRPATLADLTTYDAEADYEAELEEERRREQGYDRISLTETNENDV